MRIKINCPFSTGGAGKGQGGRWALHQVIPWIKSSPEYSRCCSWKTVQHFKEIVPVHCTSDKVFTVSGTFIIKETFFSEQLMGLLFMHWETL